MHQAALMCRKRGRIVLVGVTGLELSRDDFFKKELTLQVSCSYGPGRYDINYEEKGQDYPVGYVRWTEQRNFEAVLDMMADGRLDVKPLISHRFTLEQTDAAYAVVGGSEPSLGILLEYSTRAEKSDAVIMDSTVSLVAAQSLRGSGGAPAVAFVGSGSSKRVGYPDWDELLSLMEGEIRTKDPTFNGSFHREAGDTLWHAYKLKERLGENFYPFIKKTFEPKNNRHNAFHINLMSLSFQHIITSNYDSVLEDAFSGLRKSKPVERFCWNEKEKLCDFIRRMNDPLYKDTIQIFYVHGRYDSQDSIVLTERDYTNRYHEGNLAIKPGWPSMMAISSSWVG